MPYCMLGGIIKLFTDVLATLRCYSSPRMVNLGALLPSSIVDWITLSMTSLLSMISWIFPYFMPWRCCASCEATLKLNCLLVKEGCFWKDSYFETWCAFSKSFNFEEERLLFLREKPYSLVAVLAWPNYSLEEGWNSLWCLCSCVLWRKLFFVGVV